MKQSLNVPILRREYPDPVDRVAFLSNAEDNKHLLPLSRPFEAHSNLATSFITPVNSQQHGLQNGL